MSNEADYDGSMSYDEYEDFVAENLWPTPVEKMFVLILIAMMTLGVVGNMLVVVVVISKRSMWSSMNIFLTNLACADLLVLLVCLPPTIINDVTKTFWFSTVICKSILFFQNTCVYVSILSLVFITYERWRAIVCPLKTPITGTRNIIACTWIVAMLLSSPEPYTLQLQEYDFQMENFTSTWGTQCKESWSNEFERIYLVVQMIASYIFPLLLISIMCFHMSRTLNFCQLTLGKRQIAHRKKAVRMLGAVVFLFALSYLPVHMYNIASSYQLFSIPENEKDIDLTLIAIRKLAPRVFSYSSSCLNPLLYNFMCGKFRKEFARVVCCGSAKQKDSLGSRNTTFERSPLPRHSMLPQC